AACREHDLRARLGCHHGDFSPDSASSTRDDDDLPLEFDSHGSEVTAAGRRCQSETRGKGSPRFVTLAVRDPHYTFRKGSPSPEMWAMRGRTSAKTKL